jgi:hypothetical protein
MAKAHAKPTPGEWKIARWKDRSKVDGFSTVITDSRGHGIVQFLQFGKNPKVEANAQAIRAVPELFELLDNVAAALETTLVFYGVRMPADDRKTREKLVNQARKLTKIWRLGV